MEDATRNYECTRMIRSFSGNGTLRVFGASFFFRLQFLYNGNMDNTTKQILEIVTNIQEQMSTKDDTRSIRIEMEEIRRDLQKQIMANTEAIAELSEQIRNVFGYAKEIDMLMTRVSTIEKHVGIK